MATTNRERESKRKSPISSAIEEKSTTKQKQPFEIVSKKEETRSKRRQITLKPSLDKLIEQKCKKNKISFNEAVNQLLEYWIKEE